MIQVRFFSEKYKKDNVFVGAIYSKLSLDIEKSPMVFLTTKHG